MSEENLKPRKKGDKNPFRGTFKMPGTAGGTSSRVRMGQALALHFLNDREYRQNVMLRLRAGEAPQLEVFLWRQAFGDPPKDDGARQDAEKRFEAIRRELRELMKEPERARLIAARVTRAPALLPMPRLSPTTQTVVAEEAEEPDRDAES